MLTHPKSRTFPSSFSQKEPKSVLWFVSLLRLDVIEHILHLGKILIPGFNLITVTIQQKYVAKFP